MTYPPRPEMRGQLNPLINAWGVPSKIDRLVATTNAQGRLSGSFVTQVTDEILWIQPAGGGSEVVELGIDEQTTHLAFQKWPGFEMVAKDRVTPSGQTYEYDVLKVHRYETHLLTELKLVRRT